MAQQAVSNNMVSIRLACQAFSISETCYRYQSLLSSENEKIAEWLGNLTEKESDWEFELCFDYLCNVKALN
jgi:putative transposase